ncbi:MAG: CARDB domain-containing protein [Candidatus Nanosalina sp.]
MRKRNTLLAVLTVFLAVPVTAQVAPDEPGTDLEPNPVYDDNDAYCLGTFSDQDSNIGNVTVNWTVSSSHVHGEKYLNVANNTRINSTLLSSNFTEGQEVLCNVTVKDSSGGIEWELDNAIADTFDPEVTSGPNFHNYSSEHAFNVSAVLLDRESDDEIRQCWMNATDPSGNNITRRMNLRRYYGDGDEARCYFSRIDQTFSEFEVLEQVNVTVWANDSGGGYGNESRVNPVPNSRPRVFNIRPSNDATISSSSVDLSARVEDQDGENMEVKFIDIKGSTSVLQTYTGVSPGSEKSTTWNGLNQLTTYYWRLNVSDGYQTTSRQYRFRNQFPSQFRIETGFETPYSSILVSPNTSRTVRYSVYNGGASSKNNLVTTVYTADGVIAGTGTRSSSSYSLAPGERKYFNIRISPEREGVSELVVATDSSNYYLNTTERIEVYVDDRPGTTANVPGIGVLQIVFLLVFSTLYYSARL